jgi:hypothetical protein
LAQKTNLKQHKSGKEIKLISGNNFSSWAGELSSEITVKGTSSDFDHTLPSYDHSYNFKRRESTAQ